MKKAFARKAKLGVDEAKPQSAECIMRKALMLFPLPCALLILLPATPTTAPRLPFPAYALKSPFPEQYR
jgi:hypothetical protein